MSERIVGSNRSPFIIGRKQTETKRISLDNKRSGTASIFTQYQAKDKFNIKNCNSTCNSTLLSKPIDMDKLKKMCLPQIKFALLVFDSNLKSQVFHNSNIRFDQFVEISRDSFLLDKESSILLTQYIYSSDEQSQRKLKYQINSELIVQKLTELVPNLAKIEDSSLQTILMQIFSGLKSEEVKSVILKVESNLKSDYILPFEFIQLIQELPLKDSKIKFDSLIALLLRKSQSLLKIKSNVIKKEMLDLAKSLIKVKFRSKTLSYRKESKKSHTESKESENNSIATIKIIPPNISEVTIEEQQSYQREGFFSPTAHSTVDKNGEIKEMLIRLCEQIYSSKLTMIEIVNNKIFDHVIDGTEYQLIKRGDFIQSLDNHSILLTRQDILLLRDVIKPIWVDAINVKNLEEITKCFGIFEDYPPFNRFLDYHSLTGPTIRTFNKIILYMKENKIADIIDLISSDKIKKVQITSKTKEETVDIISPINLEIELKNKGILKRSEHLEQEFTDFIELNDVHENIIMIRKLRKCINDIQKSSYFERFGTAQRIVQPNETHKLLRKAITQCQTGDYSSKIDRSITNVETTFESKFQKAKAKISILKWKGLIMKTSKLSGNFEKDNISGSKTNQRSRQEYSYMENSKLKKEEQLFESTNSIAMSSFDQESINKDLKRKRFGLA